MVRAASPAECGYYSPQKLKSYVGWRVVLIGRLPAGGVCAAVIPEMPESPTAHFGN
ncbi:hypothetical protein KCP75_21945 [Salmonella enterica subsp. enterica]|nr:hypothetical protein KCP75_21945 [Salmonella enterica subsp. enterica]